MALCVLVEDHGDTREGYAEYLTLSGFEVRCAGDGTALREILEVAAPAAVIMDLRLPWEDGWSLIRALKADPGTRDVPVLVVSACVLPTDVAHAEAAGCDAFLAKPCAPSRIVTELRRLLERSHHASDV